MTFWAKSLRVFNYLWEHGTQSVRRIARKTGFSKSSVHRLQQAIARRGCHPESWLWETEEGRGWLIRLVVRHSIHLVSSAVWAWRLSVSFLCVCAWLPR